MSAEATGYVFRASPYQGAAFAVHLAIADSVNDQHEYRFWMSIATLARKARVSERAAQYSLRKLVCDGAIELVDDLKGGRGHTGEYRFLFRETVQMLHPSPGKGANDDTERVQDPTGKGAQVAPEPKENPSTSTQVDCEQSPSATVSPPADWSGFEDIEALLVRLQWKGRPMSETDLFDPSYWPTIEQATEGTRIFYDEELRDYVSWLNKQPPSFRRRSHQRGFMNWIAKTKSRQAWAAEKRGRRASA